MLFFCTFQLEVPDPRSMTYNASNFPVVKNNNAPGVIRGLPPSLKNRKKKGISKRDLQMHNKELNIPHNEGTY